MGGHVAKKLGDGLMALFGYPLAHEDDAERAARAALLIQRALANLNRKNAGIGKPELKTRIGLETGPVVVDATGEVYGDVPNTAARVQAFAEPRRPSIIIGTRGASHTGISRVGTFLTRTHSKSELSSGRYRDPRQRLARAYRAGRDSPGFRMDKIASDRCCGSRARRAASSPGMVASARRAGWSWQIRYRRIHAGSARAI